MTTVFTVAELDFVVHGDFRDIYKRLSCEWAIIPLGDDKWNLYRPKDIVVNGESYRSYVLNLYKQKELTDSLIDRFCKDIESGKVKI